LAFTSGLQRNKAGKISQLKNLIASFPQSKYVADAHFELGRTFQEDAQYVDAKREYQTIIDRYKESTLYPRALLQMGLINYNTGDFQSSLRYYKEVAERYTGTQEAQAALIGIRNCYVEMNDVDAYFAYAGRLGSGTAVTVSTQDSLTYMTAEKQFMAGDPNAATQLRRYLQQFPNGSFVLNANFYLAEALYNSGQYTQSLENYVYVARQPINVFSEQALAKASELLFNARRFDEALELYDRLETVSNNKWNTVRAIAGKMRSNFQLERYRNAIDESNKLKEAEKSNETLLREANYIGAKSYYLLGNFDQALPGLQAVAVETNSQQGAESKYLVAEINFKKNNLAAAEKEIMDFISKGTQHQFWLAKSFLLLADIFVAKKDDFQAKHTLRSLLDNYPVTDDGIKSEATSKLAQIEEREKRDADAVRSNPMQIRIN
jgi:TolA-binding protein